MQATGSSFPKKFLWGAASSAHQVEGGNHNDWSEWEKLGKVKHGEHSGQATGHFQRYAADFALAKELGHNAHRLSIEWSRIEPKPGVIDTDAIDHYRQVLTELRRLGIEPIVTLHHFTNPTWVAARGGWVNRQTVDYFTRYVTTVVRELGPLVHYWITINEPTNITTVCYIGGYWPPQEKNFIHAWQAIRNLLAAHQLAYQIIHRHDPSAKVGVANNIVDFIPARTANPLDRGLRFFSHYWHNQWWLDQTYLTQDFIGLNFYFTHPLKFRLTWPLRLFFPQPMPDRIKSDLGWPICPEGLGRVLTWLQRYHRPIIVTENGIADASDHLRAGYIRSHLAEVAQALAHGVDIRGYFYWALTDNFEWHEGFDPRFGLVAIDYHTLQRSVRPSAYTYRQIIESNGEHL